MPEQKKEKRRKRGANFQKIVDKVNQENKKFITSGKITKPLDRKKVFDQKYKKYVSTLAKLSSEWNVVNKSLNKLIANSEGQLSLVLKRVLSLSQNTTSNLNEMKSHLELCIEKTEKMSEEHEIIKDDHRSFVHQIINLFENDKLEECK